jgi:hypothetical protein
MVQIIWDRRLGERRRTPAEPANDNRRGERRRTPPMQWGQLNYMIASQPTAS